MPELPEVETIRRGLAEMIVGKTILDLVSDWSKKVQPSLEEVKSKVIGTKICEVKRRAKMLILVLDNGYYLTFHLKMTGRLIVRKKDEPKDKWQHYTFSLSNNLELRFCDSRKFGWIRLVENKSELDKVVGTYGKEPFDDLDLESFKKILSTSGRPIKIILMDQSKISGVGNIYAAESLFLAKIDPRRPANKISNEEAKNLFEALEKVLKLGLEYRGASDQYYLDAHGEKGQYQEHFLVYGRTGHDCPKPCEGKIKRVVVGGRGTFFCPACQK